MYLVSQQRIFCLLCCSYSWISPLINNNTTSAGGNAGPAAPSSIPAVLCPPSPTAWGQETIRYKMQSKANPSLIFCLGVTVWNQSCSLSCMPPWGMPWRILTKTNARYWSSILKHTPWFYRQHFSQPPARWGIITVQGSSQLGLCPRTSLVPTCFPCWPPSLHLGRSLVAHAVSSSLFTSGYWARGEPLLSVIGLGRKQGQRGGGCVLVYGARTAAEGLWSL